VKLIIVTDAWHPQVNGVVRSLATTAEILLGMGHQVEVIEPSLFRTMACPTYPEIRLALGCTAKVRAMLDASKPDAVHIATEGPLGWAARGWCLKRGKAFTTSFHTRFPDYVAMRTGLPAEWIWPVMRLFHGPAERTFAVTRTLAEELESRGIGPVHHWPLGVDIHQFNPAIAPHPALRNLPRPIMLNVGRVAVEKNIEAFLNCPVPGSKVVVGDGPALEALQARYSDAMFMGAKHGAELASIYRAADIFVFPSLTDTFGLVNIEALASGLPVAAYPVRGPIDILGADGRGVHGGKRRIGGVDQYLAAAIQRAMTADRVACASEARHYSWGQCTERFLEGLATDAPLLIDRRAEAA
jgi:glycosyltransferase involved in cell wall biosynthesis